MKEDICSNCGKKLIHIYEVILEESMSDPQELPDAWFCLNCGSLTSYGINKKQKKVVVPGLSERL